MKALGFIETCGMIGAIEAADVMLKAADVHLVGQSRVGAGLVTVTVAGEVAAVQASVDAAAVAVQCITGAKLVSQHVIARPDTEVAVILPGSGSGGEKDHAPVPSVAGGAQAKHAPAPSVAACEETLQVTAVVSELDTKVSPIQYSVSQLKKMDTNQLRQHAQKLPGFPLNKEEIALAVKKVLIEEIVKAYRQRKE